MIASAGLPDTKANTAPAMVKCFMRQVPPSVAFCRGVGLANRHEIGIRITEISVRRRRGLKLARICSFFFAALGLVLLASSTALEAQVGTNAPQPVLGARPVTIERIKVHSPAITGNLEGETPDRDVLVVLPPSYAKSPHRRYPVVYALHGYSIGP